MITKKFAHPRTLLLGTTVAGAVLLSTAPAAILSNVSTSVDPTVMTVDHITLLSTLREPLPLKPRGEGEDTETAEDAWSRIPGGLDKGGTGRLSDTIPENTIKSECASANGSYTTTAGSSARASTCSWPGVGGIHQDVYYNGRYSHTVNPDGTWDDGE